MKRICKQNPGYRIERSLQYKKMETDFNAASSLLHLTCDSVVELDADLRMTEHKASLSAMLLRRRPGATLAGMDFTDLLAGAAEASRWSCCGALKIDPLRV